MLRGFKGQPDWLAGAVLVGAFDLPTDTANQMIYDYFGDPPEKLGRRGTPQRCQSTSAHGARRGHGGTSCGRSW